MKYAINHDTRKGGSQGILNNQIYDSFEEACAGIKEYLTYDNEPPDDCDDFGGQISKGVFYSEEETLEVIKLND